MTRPRVGAKARGSKLTCGLQGTPAARRRLGHVGAE